MWRASTSSAGTPQFQSLFTRFRTSPAGMLSGSVRGVQRSAQRREKDYYRILGIPEQASAKDIKAAYIEAVKRHHPDTKVDLGKDRDSRADFHMISEAYDVLGDELKRTQYDITRRRVLNRASFNDRYHHNRREWNRERMGFERTNSELDHDKETPVSSTEYLTFIYCGVVGAFSLYVMILFLK